MKGRKRTPTVLKLIAGNPGRRPLNTNEPDPPGELIDPPADFTDSQKQLWKHALDNAPRGLLRLLDQQALAGWVVAADIHRTAREAVKKSGLVVLSPSGMPMQNPYLPIINRQAEIMLRYVSELGFSPTSRSRITTGAGRGAKETNRFANNAARRRA